MQENKKEKFNPASTKSIIVQIIIGFIFLIGFFLNLFINWGYFSEYSGLLDFSYYFAHAISDITMYGFFVTVITFICSMYIYIKKNKKHTKNS